MNLNSWDNQPKTALKSSIASQGQGKANQTEQKKKTKKAKGEKTRKNKKKRRYPK